MTVAAALKFVQGATIGVAGQALFGIAGTSVTVSNAAASPGSVVTWTFTVVAVPSGSSIPLGVAQSGATPTWAFTPDVSGCFIIEITVLDASGNTASDVRAFGIKTASGHLIPSFTGDANSLNFAGQQLGWDPYMEAWLQALELLIAGSLGGQVWLVTSSYTCDSRSSVKDYLILTNFSASGTIELPVAPGGLITRTIEVRGVAGNEATYPVTIVGQGGAVVDGNAAGVLMDRNNGAVKVESDSSGKWWTTGVR
jgi:hypothetical protein